MPRFGLTDHDLGHLSLCGCFVRIERGHERLLTLVERERGCNFPLRLERQTARGFLQLDRRAWRRVSRVIEGNTGWKWGISKFGY